MLMTWVLHGPALLVAWTDWPPLFAWTSTPPCSYDFSARWFCHTLQVHTAPSLHLPLFLEETFLHTLVSPLFMECKLHMGQSTFKASKQHAHSGNKGALHGPALLVAWTGCPPPPPPPLFAWTGAPPCSYNFSARWFCHTLQVHTAPSLPKGQHHRHTHVSIVAQCGLCWVGSLG